MTSFPLTLKSLNTSGGMAVKEFSQQIVSTIQYTIVERFIENFEQKSKVIIHTLILEKSAVISNAHRFQLEHVQDISYKNFSDGSGHLYLHTNQGVFSFVISKNPSLFINAYRKLKNTI